MAERKIFPAKNNINKNENHFNNNNNNKVNGTLCLFGFFQNKEINYQKKGCLFFFVVVVGCFQEKI